MLLLELLPELELELLESEALPELELLSALELLLELELLPGLLELGCIVVAAGRQHGNSHDCCQCNSRNFLGQSHLDVPPVFGLKIQTETNP